MSLIDLFVILNFFSGSLSMTFAQENWKAMFVFGDSIVDSGNNDFLNTSSRANYFPYGVDFPMGHTGRFTNGRTPADVLGQLLGLPCFLPVFYDPLTKGSSILSGVNYASAGAGILDSTNQANNVISLSNQITNFQDGTLPDLKSQLEESRELCFYLSESIFFFCFGGVDFFANCATSSGVAVECDLEGLTELLIGNYTNRLKRVYDSGARKFVVLNVLQNGCDPYFRKQNNGSCLEILNEASILFNNRLKSALEGLSRDMPGFAFVYVNMSGIVSDIMNHPTIFGLKNINESCCLTTSSGGGISCAQGEEPCPERNTYAYYDGVHPTEKLYVQASTRAYSSELETEAYPYNVEKLASLTIESHNCDYSVE